MRMRRIMTLICLGAGLALGALPSIAQPPENGEDSGDHLCPDRMANGASFDLVGAALETEVRVHHDSESHTISITKNNRRVGTIITSEPSPTDNYSVTIDVRVEPDFRRQGYGTALFLLSALVSADRWNCGLRLNFVRTDPAQHTWVNLYAEGIAEQYVISIPPYVNYRIPIGTIRRLEVFERLRRLLAE